MQKLQRSVFINAPREKVWEVMLADATYREWTTAFHEGSYFKGGWNKGDSIQFLGPNEDGTESGMISKIEESRKPEFLSIAHLGVIKDGVEDTSPEVTKGWVGAHENYTFIEKDGGTELSVELDIGEDEQEMMGAMWDKALPILKAIAER